MLQTVVCIPLMDGVVEFGTTDKVSFIFIFILDLMSTPSPWIYCLPVFLLLPESVAEVKCKV